MKFKTKAMRVRKNIKAKVKCCHSLRDSQTNTGLSAASVGRAGTVALSIPQRHCFWQPPMGMGAFVGGWEFSREAPPPHQSKKKKGDTHIKGSKISRFTVS